MLYVSIDGLFIILFLMSLVYLSTQLYFVASAVEGSCIQQAVVVGTYKESPLLAGIT